MLQLKKSGPVCGKDTVMTIHIQSFGLGILCVVALLLVVAQVWSMVRLRDVSKRMAKKNIEDEAVRRNFEQIFNELSLVISSNHDEVFREMDSRLDKLENRLKKNQ